jgi:hypothetical protein
MPDQLGADAPYCHELSDSRSPAFTGLRAQGTALLTHSAASRLALLGDSTRRTRTAGDGHGCPRATAAAKIAADPKPGLNLGEMTTLPRRPRRPVPRPLSVLGGGLLLALLAFVPGLGLLGFPGWLLSGLFLFPQGVHTGGGTAAPFLVSIAVGSWLCWSLVILACYHFADRSRLSAQNSAAPPGPEA